MNTVNQIPKIVLTGGPCSGKTSVLEELRNIKKLSGYRLLFISEVPSMMFASGISWKDGLEIFQHYVVKTQVAMEQMMDECAEKLQQKFDEPVAIICDRGIVDAIVYSGEELFAEICDKEQIVFEEIIDKYHLVIHLESVSVNYPDAYTKATNRYRQEDASAAVKSEEMTYRAWDICEEKRVLVQGYDSFNEKVEKTVEIIEEFLKEYKE